MTRASISFVCDSGAFGFGLVRDQENLRPSDLFQVPFQDREVFFDYGPDFVKVDSHVCVDEHISKTGDSAPGDFRVEVSQVL